MSTGSNGTRLRIVALASVAGVAGIVALFCCGPARKPSSATANDTETAATPARDENGRALADTPAPSSNATSRELASGERDAGASDTAAHDAAAAPRNPVAAAVARDARDLELLARIERELRREPPPEVHALIALRARGGTRDELVAFVRERFPMDLPLRAAALRWVDGVAPPPGGAPAPASTPAGSGPSFVRPLEKSP